MSQSNSSGHQSKVKVVDYGVGIAGLAFAEIHRGDAESAEGFWFFAKPGGAGLTKDPGWRQKGLQFVDQTDDAIF